MILSKSRELSYCPKHFVKVELQANNNPSSFSFLVNVIDLKGIARNWLHENCEHRFYVGTDITRIVNNVGILEEIAAFEVESDATFFALIKAGLFKKSNEDI